MKKIFLALIATCSLIACKKSSPAVETCTVNTNSIAGTYVVTAIQYKQSSSAAATDAYALLSECQKDDTYELKADGALVKSEAANDCHLPPMPGTPEAWSLDKNNTVLIMGSEMNILSFDCSKLVVEEKNVLTDGDSRITTYTKK